MKVIQTQLHKASRRAGDEVGFTLTSLLEISSKELGEIDSYRGDVCFIILTDSKIGNEVNVDIGDILKNLPENDLYDNHKTPSQRLRNVLYVQLQQKVGNKPTKEEFADYYKRSMEAMIGKIKETLDSD